MGRWLRRVGVVAVLLAVALLVRFTLFRSDPIPVRVTLVERGPVEETVTNSRAGTVRARRRAKLSPETGGQVVELPYREGEAVRAGDLLLRVDDSSQRAQVELARRDLKTLDAERRRACLAAERAGRELDRTRRLAGEEIVSADLLDAVETAKQEADAACEASAAGLSRAEAAVAVAEAELAKTVIRAPFDGLIAELSAEVGEWTTPSPPALPVPPIIDILDPASIYVSAPMDEVDSARIHPGQEARVSVDSHPDRSFEAEVLRVAPYVLDIEQQNRTVEIEVGLRDEKFAAMLLPGTSADVEVILERRDDVLRLPTSSLMEDNRVLVLTDERLEERSLEIGLKNWDFAEAVAGLEAGDAVVISLDRPEIEDGARARRVERED